MDFFDWVYSHYLFKKGRFAEAIAYINYSMFPIPPTAHWVLYKLGCFQSVVNLRGKVRTEKDAVAIGVSLAACGHPEESARVLRQASSGGLLKSPKLIQAAVIAIARFDPSLAVELLESGAEVCNPGAVAALYQRCGDISRARDILVGAYNNPNGVDDADGLLLFANLQADPQSKIGLLNRYFDKFGLSPVAIGDGNSPLGANNIRSTVEAGTIRGPLVSVVVPAFNTADRIGAALESYLSQTYRDIEIIVVDDCSGDGTVSVVKDLATVDGRVRLIERHQNGGTYAARNMGLEAARGDFIMCHDSDDWAHPEKIQRQVAPLLENDNLFFTMSKWARIEDNGTFRVDQVYPLTRLNPASPMFRRLPTLTRVGFYDNVRTGADSEFIARLKLIFGERSWSLLSLPLVVGAYRQGSLTTDFRTSTAQNGAMNAERLAYWESWRRRHAEALRNRESLFRSIRNQPDNRILGL